MKIETLFNVFSGCKKISKFIMFDVSKMAPFVMKVPTRDVFYGNYLTYLVEI